MEKGISGIARQSSEGLRKLFSFLLTFHLDFISFLDDVAVSYVCIAQYLSTVQRGGHEDSRHSSPRLKSISLRADEKIKNFSLFKLNRL